MPGNDQPGLLIMPGKDQPGLLIMPGNDQHGLFNYAREESAYSPKYARQ